MGLLEHRNFKERIGSLKNYDSAEDVLFNSYINTFCYQFAKNLVGGAISLAKNGFHLFNSFRRQAMTRYIYNVISSRHYRDATTEILNSFIHRVVMALKIIKVTLV